MDVQWDTIQHIATEKWAVNIQKPCGRFGMSDRREKKEDIGREEKKEAKKDRERRTMRKQERKKMRSMIDR